MIRLENVTKIYKNKTVAPPQATEPNAAVASVKNADKRTIFKLPFGKKDKGVLPEPEATPDPK